MADITNPQVVAFCNDLLRPYADASTRNYYAAKHILTVWFATNLGADVPNLVGDIVVDGAAADGREPISGFDVWNLVNRAQELVTDYEAGSNAKLNTIIKVQVNGAPKG
jgi:hypothetical protein